MKKMLEHLKQLCSCYSGAGSEQSISDLLGELLSPYGQPETDALGNLTLTIGNGKHHILLDAHIDQISLAVTGIDPAGFVRVTACGGIDRRVLLGQRVILMGKRPMNGVICNTPPHLQKNSSHKAPEIDELFVDMCCSGDELSENVSLGDRLYYAAPLRILLNDRVTAPALDNRAGVAVLLSVLESVDIASLPCTLTFLFSTREETGEQGAAVSGFSIAPDEALIVDVSFADAPGIPEYKTSPLDGGVMIGYAASLDHRMSTRLTALAAEKDIPFQREVMGGTTGTNADILSSSSSGIPACTLSFPIRNMHTPVELVSLSDMKHTAQLITYYVMEGGAGGI